MSSVTIIRLKKCEIDDKENRNIEETKVKSSVLQKSKLKAKRRYEEVDGKEVKQNKNVKRQKLNEKEADCILVGEFRPEDKIRNLEKSKKDLKKTTRPTKKLLEKQEVEAKKLEHQKKMLERRLKIEKENKIKEDRKKERERRKLEKLELEKAKKLRQEEKKLQSQRLYEAKLEKRKQIQAIKKEEKRKKIEEEKIKAELLKIELLKAKEAECKANYDKLAALDDENLVSNAEPFDCPICFTNIDSGNGVILHDCLHNFCKECLTGLVQHSETALIRCPFQNEEYTCESHLQDREVKSLVAPELFEKHLQRSVKLAESQAPNSFHCKTFDCPAWCLYEDNVNIFICPICNKQNCLTCATIHEGKTCKEYQDYIAFNCTTNEEARSTLDYLQGMVRTGEAMECPQCRIVIMKKYGCDFMTCSMCNTDICWVTKGRRWGPLGQGDISGGCRCRVNGIRCHPNCRNCH